MHRATSSSTFLAFCSVSTMAERPGPSRAFRIEAAVLAAFMAFAVLRGIAAVAQWLFD